MNTTCLRCGSDKIIPDIPLTDHFGRWGMSSQQTQVEVHGEPLVVAIAVHVVRIGAR